MRRGDASARGRRRDEEHATRDVDSPVVSMVCSWSRESYRAGGRSGRFGSDPGRGRPSVPVMLLRHDVLEAIESGRVDAVYRKWAQPG
jgi:hypothetical protein